MTSSDEHAKPLVELAQTPRDGGRMLTVGLVIGLVLCLLLAVGIALSTRHQIAELTRERDAARILVQKLTAANAATIEQFVLAARLELAELAHLLVVARQNPQCTHARRIASCAE